jgi:uncharacterized membrane protein YjgN (DUF898 family)
MEKTNFQFNGNGGEFAKLFFTNLFLSIITLGIYSAWAKVRTKKYLYGNTFLHNQSFDYHAKPIQILKSRLIVFGIFVLLNIISGLIPQIGPLFLLAMIFLVPWIINNSYKFNMYNTSHRNIRFNFSGEYGQAFFHFLVLPILGALTLGLAVPYVLFKQKKFIADNISFGQTKFVFNGKAKSYYGIYVKGLALLILGFAVAGGLSTVLDPTLVLIISFAILLLELFVVAYLFVNVTNYFYEHLELSNINFSSSLEVKSLATIYIKNTIFMILTLGIYTPWAKINVVKYRLSNISVVASEQDLEIFVANNDSKGNSLAEEGDEILDLDTGGF